MVNLDLLYVLEPGAARELVSALMVHYLRRAGKTFARVPGDRVPGNAGICMRGNAVDRHALYECDGCNSHMTVGPLSAGRRYEEAAPLVCLVCGEGTMLTIREVEKDDQ